MSRYDDEGFTTFTTEDGLADVWVLSIAEDREGHLWFGTRGGGVSRYDGKGFTTFTTEDGLAHSRVGSILEDREGSLWFGTEGGVGRYDGRVFQSVLKRDGLGSNAVQRIFQDRDGDIWIATEGGVTRYRPGRTSPRVRLTNVVAGRRYDPAEEIRIPSSQKLVIFEFLGRSLTTRPERMAYVYRLEGYDADWRITRGRRAEYQELLLGEYAFQVRAVDRDLNYSEPVTVPVIIEPDPQMQALTEALSGTSEQFVGTSNALRRVQQQLAQVAPTDATVLILGETGTGKGLAARTVHELSRRKAGRFVLVDCGAIAENLVESELFGHERGAFTGADSRKLGKVELAEGGTLFLDEIGDMPLDAQVKLLRVLQDRTFERVGGTERLQADVRVIAATNRDLQQRVSERAFREDLYFRLRVFPVRVPPLRERREDIPALAAHFMKRIANHVSKEATQFTPQALAELEMYDWPGNVRELEHVVHRAVIVCSGREIRAEDLLLERGDRTEEPAEELVTLEDFERRYILRVLEQAGGVIAGPHGAAAILGLHESTLRGRMRKMGILGRQAEGT